MKKMHLFFIFVMIIGFVACEEYVDDHTTYCNLESTYIDHTIADIDATPLNGFIELCVRVFAYEEGIFYVFDDTGEAQLRFDGDFALNQTMLGQFVYIKATRQSDYLRLQSETDIVFIEGEKRMPMSIRIDEFEDIPRQKRITLVDVDIVLSTDGIPLIFDKDAFFIAGVQGIHIDRNHHAIDVSGVYNLDKDGNQYFIVHTLSDIVPTLYEEEFDPRLIAIVDQFVMDDYIVNGRYFKTEFEEINLSYSSNDANLSFFASGYVRHRTQAVGTLETTIDVTFEHFHYGTMTKSYPVTLETTPYYQIPEGYRFLGPIFPYEITTPFSLTMRNNGVSVATVNRYIDGDTTSFLIHGSYENTRYFNIDTMETWPLENAEPFGGFASRYVETVLRNANIIHLQGDPGDGPRDTHGRLLAWVWADHELLQYHLVRLGLAEVKYLFGADLYTPELLLAQQQAQAERLGIWGSLKDPYWNYN